MLYSDYLKTVKVCPFCKGDDRRLKDARSAYLTYNKAPYHKHHLLVVPSRHVVSFFDLTTEEEKVINGLLFDGARALKKLGYGNLSILVREGNAKNKSIEHLHYHIVPNIQIGDLQHDGRKREIISNDEISQIVEEVEKVLSPDSDRSA